MSKSRTPKPRSGGGLTVNKLVRVGQKVAPRTTNVINPNAPDFLGQATSFKKPPLVERTAPDFAKMGNALTNNCGPNGEGRTIYKTGFQSCHGTPAKGEPGMQGKADRGSRAILGPPANTGAVRRGQQRGE